MTPTLSRRNRDFTHISINKAPPPLLSPIDIIPSKKRVFLSLLYCSPPIMGRRAPVGWCQCRGDGYSLLPDLLSLCPVRVSATLPAAVRQYYIVSSQSTSDYIGNTMPSINSAEYWSPPRRKILRVVAVRPTKRDWAAPAEPHRTQKPQLLCARCGHTWEPRQFILRSGRLPKRCPHCASPRWNQPYERKRRSEPSRISE